MPGDFADAVRPQLEGQLEAGETLRGLLAATHQKTFTGGLYAIGVTDRRLLLQPLDRKLHPKQAAASVTRESLSEFELDGAGGGWLTAPLALLDATSLTLKLRLADGEKLKLLLTRGGTALLGGESQQQGVAALGEWLAATHASA